MTGAASRALMVRVATPGYHFGHSSHPHAHEATGASGEDEKGASRSALPRGSPLRLLGRDLGGGDNDNRTPGQRHDMLGYRADPGADQSAVPMRSENQQVGFAGRVDQNLRGVSIDHLAGDDHWLSSPVGVVREGL